MEEDMAVTFILALIVFSLALAGRLVESENRLWILLAGAVVAFALMLIANFAVAAIASLMGALAPELWRAMQAVVRGSRIAGIIGFSVIGIVLYQLNPVFVQGIISYILVFGLVCLGIWAMIRPLIRRN
jgi:hypothetical protein